ASDGCAQTLVERFNVEPEELPIVLCPSGTLLRNPTEGQLARCVGLVGPLDSAKLYDLVVIGAGPAGLATSVYAASEGLSVLATGARYRRLSVDQLDQYEGTSVHYWASPLEADLCAGEEVALVGGGNSAGQATVFLATRARRVTLIARRPLEQTMSHYLIERIRAQSNIEVVIGCEISELEGAGGALQGISWRDRQSGTVTKRPVRYLFSFIGAEPNTDWLAGSGLKLDGRGFVLTGDDVGDDRLPMETSRSGIFGVGDVRACSVKRVAAAVGDGAQVVAAIHAYLARERETVASPPMAQPVAVTA